MSLEYAKPAFELLIECLEKNKDIHLHIIWGTLALQIAAIGWFLSSESARSHIAANKEIRIIGVAIVSLITVIHFWLLIGTCRASAELVTQITQNAYFKAMPEETTAIIDFWKINTMRAAMRGLFTFSLFGSIGYLIYSCSPHKSKGAHD